MKIEITVPEFAEGAKSIKLRQWLVGVGDAVREGDEIAEATTDKIAVYIEAPSDGTVAMFLAQEGDTIEVGQVIAIIEA